MWEDAIVKEVRETRLEIEKEADYDVAKLYQQALDIQNKTKARLVSKPLPKITTTIPERA